MGMNPLVPRREEPYGYVDPFEVRPCPRLYYGGEGSWRYMK